VNAELEHIWSRIRSHLALVLEEDTYELWIAQLTPVGLRGDELLLAAPAHSCDWVSRRFRNVIQASAELVLGDGATIAFQPHESSPTPASAGPAPAASVPADPLGNPRLTFDQFVIGDCNRLAHAAALTVAELPGQAYNPLFLCGPPGVGKTHLLSAIANLIRVHNPTLTVRATTGEAFTNEFLGSLQARSTEAFKSRFRDTDVLLVDDVQFLERKARTEEEFFHTFNALYDSGRQLVLTSDRPPRDLQALEDRLRERFQAGLVADVQPPDLATRMTILRKRVQQDGIELDEHILQIVAEHVQTNVRALEGALIRLVAYGSLTGKPIEEGLARKLLDNLYPPRVQPSRGSSTVPDIQRATCEEFGISREELLSSSRSPRVAWPRQLAMYLSRELTDESLPAIGRLFGGRDHTTVLHAHRRAGARIQSEDHAQAAVQKLCSTLGLDHDTIGKAPPDRRS
jgi:chromosomal replication initiator protein